MSTFLSKTNVDSAPSNWPQQSSALTEFYHADLSGIWAPISTPFDPEHNGETLDLPPIAQLLTDGGDTRIVCGSTGSNRYGCSALPEPDVLAFGSSTASTISPAGFAAADALRDRLRHAARVEKPFITYRRELDRLRLELTALCGLEELTGLEIIFGASGTDLHLFASQLMVETCAPVPLIVRVESAETGRGVPDALAGRHFSDCAALGDTVIPSVPLDCGRPIEILEVKCRMTDGSLRPAKLVDQEVEEATARAAASGRRVLITLVDISKTGLLAPSPACVAALQRRFPEWVEVLVDACQFRLAPETLKAYLKHDFVVAITGSKFITGPIFCGALFVPPGAARRLRTRTLPAGMKSYSARADWPRNWAAQDTLKTVANYGLVLRWEAALTELRAFRQLSNATISDFLKSFTKAIHSRLAHDPAFELIPTPRLDRGPIASEKSWDQLPTIFSFLLRRQSSSGKQTWLNKGDTKRVHERLRDNLHGLSGCSESSLPFLRCQIGQPVDCGTREGTSLSALRICVSSRLIVDAMAPHGRGKDAIISEAMAVLDKTALLASFPLN